MEATWNAVDEYFDQQLAPSDDALDHALAANTAAGLPPISVTPTLGKFLQLLVRISGTRRILEVGTLGGYSTIWMARALGADGEVISLEINEKHADVARGNIERAGLTDRVQILVAPATESLAQLAANRTPPFDLIFIDADKVNNDRYFTAALGLSHVGTIIVIDNVVRNGEVVNAASTDPNIQGIRRMTDLLAREPRVSATAVQTVGSKGYDGFILARVTAT